ncbi:anaerobic sulfatase maturase [Vibrio neonatus]|uniref:anaerobic sulfatase maturase n=1 Tax=Vibrio neonatus TaxID=278860 RepID=UPI0021C3D85F|nr:anaerobic sulfatase maturase [Vibrio neonatus]
MSHTLNFVNNEFNGKEIKRMHIMAKPIGAVCNIDCNYCYYLSKQGLLDYKKGCSPEINDETLEHYIKSYISSQNASQIIFSWQGGEPTLLGVSFFEKVVALQAKYRPSNVEILNDLQTNGTLIDEKWCQFLKANNFLVGLSIDGPQMLHDSYRTNKSGRGTFNRVMQTVDLFHQHQVQFTTLTCVNNLTSRNPLQVYRFLRDEVRSPIMQFISIVEKKDFRECAPDSANSDSFIPKQGDKALIPGNARSIVEPWCVSDIAWGNFLIAIFDEWYQKDIGRVHVQYFEAILQAWSGGQNPMCTLGPVCGKGMAMEPNGDIYTCDHYVYPEYKTGNILEDDLATLAFGSQQALFGLDKINQLPEKCQQCDYQFACFGECPKNRFIKTATGEAGLNYLCAGWHKFFSHADKDLSQILRTLKQPVANGKHIHA